MVAKIVKVEPHDLVVFADASGPAASIGLVERDGRAWNEEFE